MAKRKKGHFQGKGPCGPNPNKHGATDRINGSTRGGSDINVVKRPNGKINGGR